MWMAAKMRLAEGEFTRSVQPYDPLAERMIWDLKRITKRYEDWQQQETERQRIKDYFEYQEYLREHGEGFNQATDSYATSSSFGPKYHPDPRGYYAVLGVQADASKEVRLYFVYQTLK
jgi:hypothetical protein